MDHFPSMCCSSTLNTQVLFYDGHDSHFDDREFNILRRHKIQSLILKAGDSVHDHPNYNCPNMKLNNFYGNARMDWMRHDRDLKFSPSHTNSVLVKTWEAFKLPSATTTQKIFKKTRIPHLSPLDIDTNHQAFLAGTQQSNRDKLDDIGRISKASIAHIEMAEVRTTDPMVIMKYKGRCWFSRNLLIRAAAYDTVRSQTVLHLSQIKREDN